MPVYISPQATDAPVIAFIEQARGDLTISNYFVDDGGIMRAISLRVQRNPEWRTTVIVEPRPYGMGQTEVAREFGALQQTGATIERSPGRFATGRVFDHAKFAVAANEALIGTANWSDSAFRRNREYIYVTQNQATVAFLESLAASDASGGQVDPAGPPPSSDGETLVVSPYPDTEQRLAGVIDQPGPVGVETEEMAPGNPLMRTLASKGADAYLILPASDNGRQQQAVAQLEQAGVHVREIREPYMHAKVICGDRETFLGSQNFSTTSLTENREVGIILADGRPSTRAIIQQFKADWSAASAPGAVATQESAPGWGGQHKEWGGYQGGYHGGGGEEAYRTYEDVRHADRIAHDLMRSRHHYSGY